MTVAQRVGFRDAAAAVITALCTDCQGIRDQCPYRHSMFQVAGAISRELVRTAGQEDVGSLINEIVERAFLNDLARVIDGWPETIDFVRPSLFFTFADILRAEFHQMGLGYPHVYQDFSRYSFLDTNLPMVVLDSMTRNVLFASPSMMALSATLSERAIDLAKYRDGRYGTLVHEQDKARIATDRMLMMNGMSEWKDRTYRTIWTYPDTMHIYLGTKIHDGNGQYIGELLIFDLLHSNMATSESLSKYLHSSEYAVQPAQLRARARARAL